MCTVGNLKCMAESTLFNLHPNNYNQRLRYYPFAVNLDRCVWSCNTLNYVQNNTYRNK